MVVIKKKSAAICISIFFIICALPVLLTPFSGGAPAAEKRALAEFPSIVTEEGRPNLEFFNSLSDYLSDRFYFRAQLVSVNSLIKENVFKTSGNEKVIVGKNGWLFFHETLDDYTGGKQVSERGLNNMVSVLRLIDEYVRDKGGKFIFVPAPNKNSVYPQYMPPRYIPGKSSVLDSLYAALEDEGIPFIDLKTYLRRTISSDVPLYHKRDSHWNNLGAWFVCNKILDRLNKPPLACPVNYTERVYEGDLDAMLYPSLKRLDDQVFFDYIPTYTYTSNFKSPDDITIRAENPAKTGSLLMFRDSFGNALLPFIAEDFRETCYTRAVPYNLTLMETMESPDVVIELAERNLGNLLTRAPIMPAPLREPERRDIPAAEKTEGYTFMRQRVHQGFLHLYGGIDDFYLSDKNEIYILISSERGKLMHEAFPVHENILLGEEGRGGFSAYLPLDGLPEGDFDISLIINNRNGMRQIEGVGFAENKEWLINNL